MGKSKYTVTSGSDITGEEKPSSDFPEIAIGIDFGTSHSCVAVYKGDHIELLQNIRNEKVIRSYVIFKDQNPPGGINAEMSQEDELLSGAAIFNMKRLIGRMDTDPVVQASKSLPFLVQTLDIGVRPFIAVLVNNAWRYITPEEVVARFLSEMRSMAEQRLNRPIKNVVLTVPVSFSRFQLARVERACELAGLHLKRLMPEPTAVALLYAKQQQAIVKKHKGDPYEKNALIFNMGAGYCDVTVASVAEGIAQIKSLAGAAIGGEDLLQNLMQHLLPNSTSFFLNHGINEIRMIGSLRVAAQDAIHQLSLNNTVQVNVDLGNGITINNLITRDKFEEVNRQVFEKCENLIKQCLQDSKVNLEDLSDVIVVGGCFNIPKIAELVLDTCKKKELYKAMSPMEAAARGAALEAAIASGITGSHQSINLLTIHTTPLAIGIRANGNNFIPVIPQNTTIPVRRELSFTTTHNNQTEALILVYEGEGKSVEENHLLGYFKVLGIPPAPKGVPEILVCMNIDASNVLRVFAGIMKPGTGKPLAQGVEVRMPTVDNGHGWIGEAMYRAYGPTLDLATMHQV